MYDSYAAQAQMSGGKLRSVPMIQTEVGFEVDLAALEQLFSEKTRMFIVNTVRCWRGFLGACGVAVPPYACLLGAF